MIYIIKARQKGICPFLPRLLVVRITSGSEATRTTEAARTTEATRTTKATRTSTVASLTLLTIALRASTLGEHSLQSLGWSEHLRETSIVTLLNLQTLLQASHLLLLLCKVGLNALSGLSIGKLFLLLAIGLLLLLSLCIRTFIGGKHLGLILRVDGQEGFLLGVIQTETFGQSLTRLGNHLGTLGFTTFCRLLFLCLHLGRHHQSKSHNNHQFFHFFKNLRYKLEKISFVSLSIGLQVPKKV